MKYGVHKAAISLLICSASFGEASAQQQDVCKAEVQKAKMAVDADYEQWIASLSDLPPEIRDSYKKIFDYNKANAYTQADAKGVECDKGYVGPQMVVDSVVLYYTGGLSAVLPERIFKVDVSQIMAGKPLGGPNAVIPKFRDQVLKSVGISNSSSVSKFIKDPWKCVSFQRKC